MKAPGLSNADRDKVLSILKTVADPAGGDIVAAGRVQGLASDDKGLRVTVEVPGDIAPEAAGALHDAIETALERAKLGPARVLVTAQRAMGASPGPGRKAPQDSPQTPQRGGPIQLPGIRSIIAVASGKGGVGKSTVAVNLALGLAHHGLKAGVLDADIYGPSIPRLLGLTEKPATREGKLDPLNAHGLKAMSIGLLVDTDTPMIWRGPMVTSALSQMLTDVNWGDLDVLVVDMPPGTGDAQLTLAQRVPLAGAVIVSTPQEIALIDARKALAMFRKTEVPVLGMIENMAWFEDPNSGARTFIFGEAGARRTAEALGCPFLGEIPLHPAIGVEAEDGQPIVATDPGGPQAAPFLAIAGAVAAALTAPSRPAPRIVIE